MNRSQAKLRLHRTDTLLYGPTTTHPMGRFMLFSGAVLWIAGFVSMRKLADVEF